MRFLIVAKRRFGIYTFIYNGGKNEEENYHNPIGRTDCYVVVIGIYRLQ